MVQKWPFLSTTLRMESISAFPLEWRYCCVRCILSSDGRWTSVETRDSLCKESIQPSWDQEFIRFSWKIRGRVD
ncbi:hypothetical protein DTO280E4_6706 [Paecilomyces variotii]|nr:hypothetical protein DTO280E4_6706 [Paecilomyces variotii]